jgi:hypothetical protein
MRKTVLNSLVFATLGFVVGFSTPSSGDPNDADGPKPPIVTSGAMFSHGAPPPSDAMVLFDGKDFSKWDGEKGAPEWTIHEDYMEVKPHTGYIHTKENFSDFQLHLEFAEPGQSCW